MIAFVGHRLSSGTSSSSRRATTNSSNVFDRLNGSRRALNEDYDQDSGSKRGGGALSKIKDLTKTLRKGSREEEGSASIAVAPRDSTKMFDGSRRATHSGLGNGSAVASVRRADVNGSSPRTTRRATASISKRINHNIDHND